MAQGSPRQAAINDKLLMMRRTGQMMQKMMEEKTLGNGEMMLVCLPCIDKREVLLKELRGLMRRSGVMFGESASELIGDEPSVVTEVEGCAWKGDWDESDEGKIFHLPPPRPKGPRLIVKGYPEVPEPGQEEKPIPREWSKVFENTAKSKEEKKEPEVKTEKLRGHRWRGAEESLASPEKRKVT